MTFKHQKLAGRLAGRIPAGGSKGGIDLTMSQLQGI